MSFLENKRTNSMNVLRPRSVFLRVAHQFFPAFALKDKELDFGSTTLYLILFFLAQDGRLDISQGELALYCRCSKRTIQKYLRTLEQFEYIRIENLKYSVNTYTLLHSARVDALIQNFNFETKEKSLHYDAESPMQNLRTPCAESAYLIKNIKERKHTQAQFSAQHQAKYVECEKNSTTDFAINQNRKAFLAKEKKSVVENFKSEDFDKIWEIYPVKQNYKMAQKIFISLAKKGTLPALSLLIEAIKTHTEKDRRWKAGYAPALTTWLKDERWNDEPILEKIKEADSSPVPSVSNSKFSNEEIEQIKKNALQFKIPIIEKNTPQVKEEKKDMTAQNISNLLVDTWKKKGFEASIIEGYCHTLHSENILPSLEKMKSALKKQCFAPPNIFKWLRDLREELGNDKNSEGLWQSGIFGSVARHSEVTSQRLALEQDLLAIDRRRKSDPFALSLSALCASIFKNSKKEKGRNSFTPSDKASRNFITCSSY